MKKQLTRKISQKIKSFDICALLKLLESLGYSREEIYFESNSTPVSQGSICESILFSQDRAPKVTIVLNMGLFGVCSPLPSFFLKRIETEEINSQLFIRFLSFFNHHLMQSFLNLAIPEKNAAFFLSWQQTQIQYLSLLGFESISTLWFLMQLCFPELVVEVIKNPLIMRLDTSSLILGKDCLGPKSYLGERFEQTLHSFKITLTTSDEISELGVPWPIEINRRLIDLTFPILKKTDLHLSIVLVIRNKYGSLHLNGKHYLGFDRIGKNSEPFQLLLFYGLIKNLKRNNYLAG